MHIGGMGMRMHVFGGHEISRERDANVFRSRQIRALLYPLSLGYTYKFVHHI